jgi:hypothetical protein
MRSLFNCSMPEPILMKLGMHIMAPGPISTTYFINSSHQTVSVYPPVVARQSLSKHVPAATNTRNNIKTVGRVSVYAPIVAE